jgi:chemotaxis protein methyltransferase CheR
MTSWQALAHALVRDPHYGRLKEHVIAATGLAYYQDKDGELATHLAHRMTDLRIASCDAYLARLADGRAGEQEFDSLAVNLTIGETFFFRHRELFDALKSTVIPAILRRNADSRRLRVWSAGCSIGAEAYSLSILLAREFEAELAGWDVSILGTDINREFLVQAQRGEFSEWAFRTTTPDLRTTCFLPAGSHWRIREAYRQGVSFQYHNLVQHPFPSLVNNLAAFDLILCRNVMIYFDPQIAARLASQFHDCLVPGGWLAVGHAEPNVDLFRAFRTVNGAGVVLYQRTADEVTVSIPVTATSVPAWAPPAFDAPPAVAPRPSAPAAIVPKSPPKRPSLADIRVLLDRGDWNAAAAACRQLETAERLNPTWHLYQALLSEQLGQHSQAEQALRRAIYLQRDCILAHYYLGLWQQRNHDAAGAERSLRNVLALVAGRPAEEVIADADGLTVGDLTQLTQMQLEVQSRP